MRLNSVDPSGLQADHGTDLYGGGSDGVFNLLGWDEFDQAAAGLVPLGLPAGFCPAQFTGCQQTLGGTLGIRFNGMASLFTFGDVGASPEHALLVSLKSFDCHQLAGGQAPPESVRSLFSGANMAGNMLSQWIWGVGPTSRDFGPDSVQSQEMMSAPGLAQNVSNFLAGGASSGQQDFGLGGLVSSGVNPTAQFVGSYNWSMSPSGGNLNITITNSTTAWSAFYHVPLFKPDPPTRTGWQPFGRINQTFHVQVPCS